MPEMRQLNDGTWLNEETGVVIAPENFSYYAGQNDVYTGPPLMSNQLRNPAPPLGFQHRSVLPNATAPVPQQPVVGFPGPNLAVPPPALGDIGEKAKRVLVVAGLIGIAYLTVTVKNKVNGKKKK